MCQSSSNRRGGIIPQRRDAGGRSARTAARRASRDARHDPCRWNTIRYAIGSTAKTLRFCLIVLVMIIPPALLVVLTHRVTGLG
jgi:hypothetical protein